MQIFTTYAELLEQIKKMGHTPHVLSYAPDRVPIVYIKSGGAKEPAIFITAGSHSTEQAGVTAAVELITKLDTEHQVYVIPTRDPMGMNGYPYALSLALGEEPSINSFEELEAILREQGEIFYDEDGILLVLIGDYGFANCNLLGRLKNAPAEILSPFKGRRIFTPVRRGGVEGTEHFQRAYTLIVSPSGKVLHLNRFHDTAWAPVEVRCARRLMAEIQPGLSFDLHEAMDIEDRYWLSARYQQDEENEAWEQRIARETIQAIADSGAVLVEDNYSPGGFFTRSERGVYWLDANKRGEGLNLMDYAARFHGLAFGTEMGMYARFEQRVTLGLLTVQSAVKVFEERYCT
ncbi:hypothetical protein FJZ31_43310 [Candidatus Poribacteria bacterium]|nr:hypothetical protein [Candidatus Poribacteria bacterium]